MVIWQGDVPAPAGGLLIGPQVLSCRRYLRPDQRSLKAGTIVIPLRPGIDAVRFKVVLADTEAQITGRSWSTVGIVSRANGRVAAVIVECVEVTEDAYDGIEYVLSNARAGITDPPPGARIIGVFGKDDLGLPIHIDLPLDRPLESGRHQR